MASRPPIGSFRGARLAVNTSRGRHDPRWLCRDGSTVSGPKDQLPPHSLLPGKMLWRSLLVATISSHPWLLTPALRTLSLIAHPRLSFLDVNKNAILRGILKTTFYNHFCAGEKAAEVTGTIDRIKHMGFRGVILTYAREIVVDASSQKVNNPTTNNEKANAQTTKSPEVEAWRQGVLETVEMVGTDDFLALK